jgi:NADPH-dependent 2,4-dienoyl-CoA reductase/sulfur reductase-like enzyme
VAGENALGGKARFAGSLGTQVVKVFDLVPARTGLREHEAVAAGYSPLTTQASPDDHKVYYPGAQPINIRITGDAATGKLLGAQLIGPKGTETAKRVDTYATALFHNMTVDGMSELDLSYTPPLGSPWDAVQMATQAWVRDHQLPAQRSALRPAGVS